MLAFRNLLHDRVRFAVTLVGIVFSVVVSAVQLGRFLGFTRATVDVIERSNADLWVMATGVTHLESGVPLQESLRHLALGVDGVADDHVDVETTAEWSATQRNYWLRVDAFLGEKREHSGFGLPRRSRGRRSSQDLGEVGGSGLGGDTRRCLRHCM